MLRIAKHNLSPELKVRLGREMNAMLKKLDGKPNSRVYVTDWGFDRAIELLRLNAIEQRIAAGNEEYLEIMEAMDSGA